MPSAEGEQSTPPAYAVPALDKGLDILELLVGRPEGLTLKQIAEALGRTPNEIFRMLTYLHRRAYLERHDPGGVYRLSLKLFELSHRFPPTERLLEVAIPAMRQLADQIEQSCHLSVLHEEGILVIGQIESPAKWRFSVKLGATFPLTQTASGRVLLAFLDPDQRELRLKQRAAELTAERASKTLSTQLEAIRKRGFEQVTHETLEGVTDLSCPVLAHGNQVLAALTVPVLLSHRERAPIAAIRKRLIATT
jgi:DNA-binding IclR family transcriptional regulator